MPTKYNHASFGRFVFRLAREAIEPIVLAVGLSILYSRFQPIGDIMQETSQNLLSAINTDVGAHQMIYGLLALVFLAWIWYRSWRLGKEEKRDHELTEALVSLRQTLESMRRDIKRSKINGNRRNKV